MIVDYTISISTVIQAVGLIIGAIFAFGRVMSELRKLSKDVAKLEAVPTAIAVHDLRILHLENRIALLGQEKVSNAS